MACYCVANGYDAECIVSTLPTLCIIALLLCNIALTSA